MSDKATIKLSVVNDRLIVEKGHSATTGSYKTIEILFDFQTNDWDNLVKTVVFSSKYIKSPILVVLNKNNSCEIPWEILDFEHNCNCDGVYEIGVFGLGEDGTKLPTNFVLMKAREGCYKRDGTAAPSPTLFEQLASLLLNAVTQDQLEAAVIAYCLERGYARIEQVEELPNNPEINTIYVARAAGESENRYNEYIWVNGNWEVVGVNAGDLSNFYTKEEVDTALEEKLNKKENAVSASKLEIARLIQVGGDVFTTTSEPTYFDGTKDIEIPVEIKDGAITESKIRNGAVQTEHIGLRAITREKINPGAVTNIEIANNTILLSNLDSEVVNAISRGLKREIVPNLPSEEGIELHSFGASPLKTNSSGSNLLDTGWWDNGIVNLGVKEKGSNTHLVFNVHLECLSGTDDYNTGYQVDLGDPTATFWTYKGNFNFTSGDNLFDIDLTSTSSINLTNLKSMKFFCYGKNGSSQYQMQVTSAIITDKTNLGIDPNTIYMVPNGTSGNNVYDEYMYINNKWELIGTSAVDLTDYYNKTQVNNLLSDKVDKSVTVNGQPLSGNVEVNNVSTAYNAINAQYAAELQSSPTIGLVGGEVSAEPIVFKGNQGITLIANINEGAVSLSKLSQEVKDLLNATKLKLSVVTQLPTEDIDPNTIYLLAQDSIEEQNIYLEYIYINNAWELIGSTQVDLSNYIKNTDYATNNKAGIAKFESPYGLTVDNTGTVKVYEALPADIPQKLSACRPITPHNLDQAIKIGLTTNTLTLEYTEKAAAQTWLGIPDTYATKAYADANTVPGLVTLPWASEIEIPANQQVNPITITGATEFTLGTGLADKANQWMFGIAVGDTAYDIVLPEIEWTLSIAPTFSINTTTDIILYYSGSILKGVWN